MCKDCVAKRPRWLAGCLPLNLTNLTRAIVVIGSALTRLREYILASSSAGEQGITRLTVHDIMAATIWIARYSCATASA